MQPVSVIAGTAYPFGRKNVDTDVIIPAHWLKTITRAGLGRGAFETVRAEPGNVFDHPAYLGAPILIAGDNFGCGSSREHAAWALADMGVKAVIAPSFSDIFSGNAFKNGILTVVLPQEAIDRLMAVAVSDPITIDLDHCTVTTEFQDRFTFAIDPFRRESLLAGRDEIGVTLALGDRITAYEGDQARDRPWLARRDGSAGGAIGDVTLQQADRLPMSGEQGQQGTAMTSFDDRERAFETKYAHDQEMLFRITARRNRLVGQWAAALMGLTPEETDSYAKAVIQAEFEEAGDEDVVRKIFGDLTAANVAVTESRVRAALDEYQIEARRQLLEIRGS